MEVYFVWLYNYYIVRVIIVNVMVEYMIIFRKSVIIFEEVWGVLGYK